MAKILRLDDADQRIEYNPPKAWRSVKDSGEAWNPDGTYHQTSSPGSQIFLLFRGEPVVDPSNLLARFGYFRIT